MEKRSKHYGDIGKWIEKVIDSCETNQQTFTTRKLIDNFRKQLRKNEPSKYWDRYLREVIWPIEDKLRYKRNELSKK